MTRVHVTIQHYPARVRGDDIYLVRAPIHRLFQYGPVPWLLELFHGRPERLYHWAIMVRGQCFELSSATGSGSFKSPWFEIHEPKVSSKAEWMRDARRRRGLETPRRRKIGQTNRSRKAILRIAWDIWEEEFRGVYNHTDGRECQEFAKRLHRAICLEDEQVSRKEARTWQDFPLATWMDPQRRSKFLWDRYLEDESLSGYGSD